MSGERRGLRKKFGLRGRHDDLLAKKDARDQRETPPAFDGLSEQNSRWNFFSTDLGSTEVERQSVGLFLVKVHYGWLLVSHSVGPITLVRIRARL